jgi:hypothetical protein
VSILVKGKQMVEILNECHIRAACVGNHDFGKGVLCWSFNFKYACILNSRFWS